LRRSRAARTTPYGWLAAAVPDHGLVLDVACGSASLSPMMGRRRYLALDTSAAELASAT
jgi:hypothetical protein